MPDFFLKKKEDVRSINGEIYINLSYIIIL